MELSSQPLIQIKPLCYPKNSIDPQGACLFSFCSMAVESLGEALSYGWRVTARCAAGKQEGMHRHKECVYRAELDMETLVWTRGRAFPLSRLESRLRCPMCGSREVTLLFTVPRATATARVPRL
jgi:hypothetical protein